ncbi:hypothetical protein D9757_011323 [Collybiopsis confluens]|uniref:Protein kinase domain-containing protein n=1 Tax=Collybiopsis confluens TaxID=2823264 RepID=A0A8H5LPC2_9AGAR|nr:hypothetical protein D9757_011323 [Collybiopsis confluens]
MEDFHETVEIFVEEFAEVILGMKKEDYNLGLNEAKIASRNEGFRELRDAMEKATGEKGIYHQVAKLLNRISMQPKKDASDAEDITSDTGDDKVFSVQDPFKIPGYLVGLSPDIVAVYRRVLEINKVEDLEVLIRDFEFSKGMQWALLLLFVEVKWENGRLSPPLFVAFEITSIRTASFRYYVVFVISPSVSFDRMLSNVDTADELKTPEEAAQVFYDILQVHCWLYTEARILHRDLSMGNILFRRVGGKVYGVLNDFDLSSFLPLRDEPSSQWRTGTKPYMAYDLLTNWREGPLYRHDLESLFYIMLILCCHYESPDKALPFKDWPYHGWFTSDDATVGEKKSHFILTQSAFPLQSHFERFRKWLDDISRCFSVGYIQRQLRRRGDPLKDAEQQTLLGNVTYEKMNEIMHSFDGEQLEKRWLGFGQH